MGSMREGEREALEEDPEQFEMIAGEPPQIPLSLMGVWETFWALRVSFPRDIPIPPDALMAHLRGMGIPEKYRSYWPWFRLMEDEFRTWANEQEELEVQQARSNARSGRRDDI